MTVTCDLIGTLFMTAIVIISVIVIVTVMIQYDYNFVYNDDHNIIEHIVFFTNLIRILSN